MTTNAINAQGTVLKRGSGGGSETFTAVSEVLGYKWVGSVKVIPASHFGSTAMDKLPGGLVDWGSYDINLHKLATTDAQQAGLKTDFAAKTIRNWKIELPGGAGTQAFSGFITSFNEAGQVDELLTIDITIEVTGPVVIS